jgi:hypothetical protein
MTLSAFGETKASGEAGIAVWLSILLLRIADFIVYIEYCLSRGD